MLFFISCLIFSFFYKHILLTLIRLEFIIINLTLSIYIIINILNINFYFISFFFRIMVCEAVIGLSVLVYLIRFCGNDYINLLNIIKW